MLEEPQLSSPRIVSPYREESGDQELSVLPWHTKVVGTSNNRTISVLVGLQGVVKKAVGLGGWHWLVLKNGIEVRLQRNESSVLEHPTGNKGDNRDFDYSSGSEVCGKDQEFLTLHFQSCISFRKTSKPRVSSMRPWISSASAKSLGRGSYRDVHSFMQRQQPETSNSNLGRLQMLRAVQHNFASQRVNEGEVIMDFVQAVEKMNTMWSEKDTEGMKGCCISYL